MLWRSISCIFLFFVFCSLHGQNKYSTKSKKAIDFYEEGLKNYRLYYYDIAEEKLLNAIDADANFIEPYMVLARLYTDTHQPEKAIANYSKGLKIDTLYYPHGFLYKGELEIRNCLYVDAVKSFQTLLRVAGDNEKLVSRGKRGLAQAEFAVAALKSPVEFDPLKLSSEVNTPMDEYWPVISADEQTLVFTRLVKSPDGKHKQEDFYMSEKQGNTWSKAENVGQPLNTPDNEGAQSISADGNFMVYTVCNQPGVFGRCDLYFSRKTANQWSPRENLGKIVNSGAKETQPAVSADGRVIYFTSDKTGGKGGLDIWSTSLDENGVWSIPVNMGDSINTPGDEQSAFIHPDNSTFYFSSNYWTGLGGTDIFYSRRDEQGNWSRARNIGYPINTCRDEIGLIVNARGDRAYYSSDIDTAAGRDIYTFKLYKAARPQEVSYLKGKVYNAETRQPLSAGFELYNLKSGAIVSKSVSDPVTGDFLLCIPTNCDYLLNVSKKDYLFYSDNFSLSGVFHLDEPYLKDIPLQAIKAGNLIVLSNIFFETNDFQLRNESKTELEKLVRFLNDNPGIKVEIGGHTDNVGSREYNLQLSENRAKSVVDFLKEKGIPAQRLMAKGYGFDQAIETNETEKGRAKNRRTELKILP